MSESKVWFITGAAKGLGRAWTEAALGRGDKVIATAKGKDQDELRSLVESFGDAILPLALDVTDRQAVFATIREGHDHFARIDVAVNNAGYGYMGAVEELEPEQVRANFETNLLGMLSVVQAVIPIMRAQATGHIINVSSIVGDR